MRAMQILAGILAVATLSSGADAQAAESIWSRVPGPSDILRSYPTSANSKVGGVVRIACLPSTDGELTQCSVTSEEPTGEGFGDAALALASKFRMSKEAAGTHANGVVLPIRFVVPEPSPPWREAAFKRMEGYGQFGPPGPYFPDRAARSSVWGEVVADCHVDEKGRLSTCKTVAVQPADFGFVEATMAMVRQGWMTAGPEPESVAPPSDGVWRFRVPFNEPAPPKKRR